MSRADALGFGPTVLVGLGAGAVTALASARPWVAAPGGAADLLSRLDGLGEAPLALALSLVLLAAWGVLLATRGRARRLAAVLALAAGAGVLATAGWAARVLPEQVAATLVAAGTPAEPGLTGWFWVALAAAAAGLPAAALAIRHAPSWPAMGARYDAPAGRREGPGAAGEPSTSLDYWRALDAGHDPTA